MILARKGTFRVHAWSKSARISTSMQESGHFTCKICTQDPWKNLALLYLARLARSFFLATIRGNTVHTFVLKYLSRRFSISKFIESHFTLQRCTKLIFTHNSPHPILPWCQQKTSPLRTSKWAHWYQTRNCSWSPSRRSAPRVSLPWAVSPRRPKQGQLPRLHRTRNLPGARLHWGDSPAQRWYLWNLSRIHLLSAISRKKEENWYVVCSSEF